MKSLILAGGLLVGVLALFQITIVNASEIVIEDADTIWNATSEFSSDLINAASNVTSRVAVEYSNSFYYKDLNISINLFNLMRNVTSRILTEYANSIYHRNMSLSSDLINSTSNVTARIIAEYANSIYYKPLSFPKELINDTAPPMITNVRITNITYDSATISWETNEIANGYIKYGESHGVYTKIKGEPLFFKNHSIVLNNLSPATTYYFVVNCSDQSGNEIESIEYNFTIQGVRNINTGEKFKTIQAAINAANDGDTIFVYSGIYYENVVINKSITLVGEDRNTTIIDGNYNGDVVYITADWVNISGFTIRNSGGWLNAGVKIYYANDVTIKNCNISNNYYGIWLDYSNNNSIYNCNISNNGDGISLGTEFDSSSNNNSIYNCNISNNDAGIYVDSSNNSIYNCNISNNDAGIQLWPSGNNNSIYNCNIISNNWDGIYACESSNNEIYNCNISNNGDGIWLNSSSNNEIYNCNITSNNYWGIYAYAYYSYNNSIYNCNISNNDDGIRLSSSNNNEIYNCNISNNVYGIWLNSSSNNEIYMNNFMDNSNNVNSYNSSNTWHFPEPITYAYNGNTYTNYLGNYWDDYNGSDDDNDGIGDAPYYIDEDNNDYYPLMQPWENYFGYDSIPPGIANITFPSKSHAGIINITCIASDNAGIAGVWINITMPNGSYINESMQYCHGIYYFNTSFDIEGNYSFYIDAIDANGNGNKSNVMNFTVYPIWDINMDGRINVLDLIIVAMHFGSHEGEPDYDESVDLNNDGDINILDLIIVAMHWTG